MSRIGKLPVAVPAGVKINIADGALTVEGPKGKLSRSYNSLVQVKFENSEVSVTRVNDTKEARSFHGLYRNLIHNMVVGVSQGFSKTLVVNGVGYRAEVQGKLLVMALGYSNDFIALIPEGIEVKVEPQGNKIIISGIDKEKVGELQRRSVNSDYLNPTRERVSVMKPKSLSVKSVRPVLNKDRYYV